MDLSNDNDSEAGSGQCNLDSSSESECETVESEVKPLFKTRDDFRTAEEYEKYIADIVRIGTTISYKDNEGTSSETGTVVKVLD